MSTLHPAFEKHADGLIPAVIQNFATGKILMLGYMNEEAFEQSTLTNRVTFFSRSKGRLWVKGESSRHYLEIVSISLDCDSDAILIQANPQGPTCHTGAESCFADSKGFRSDILNTLEALLIQRQKNPQPGSYSSKLLSEELSRSAQKVGEEGLEVALASVIGKDGEFVGEVADLWFHCLVLLVKKNVGLSEVLFELEKRNGRNGMKD